MKTPTLAEIGSVLRTLMFKTVGKSAVVLEPGADTNPDIRDILLIHAVNPGTVSGAEMGGSEALSIQYGVYTITLSYPKGKKESLDKSNVAWELAQKLTQAFYRQDLETVGGCRVMIDEPYTTNVGTTPDGRLALSVTVPWHTWTGGY